MCWESCTKIMRKRWVFVAIHQSLWQSPRPCFNEQSQSLLLYHSQWYPQISSDFWLIAITEWFFFFTTFIRFFLHHAAAGALDSFGGAGWIPSSKSSKSSKSLVSFVEYWTILMAPWQPESDLGCFPMTLWTCPFEKRSREVSEIGFFLVWNDGPKWLRLCWHLRVLYCRWAWRSSSQLSKNQEAIFIVGGVLKWGYLKWMVYREHPIKMTLKNDLGVPLF